MAKDRIELAKACYRAYETGDRDLIEGLIGADFSFISPADPQGLDRDGYFERCWPGAGRLAHFEFVRLIERGDEVVVTYEATRNDGYGVVIAGDRSRVVLDPRKGLLDGNKKGPLLDLRPKKPGGWWAGR